MVHKSHFVTGGQQQDPCPDLPIERGPDDNGVGSWVPGDKHRLLAEYLFASRHAWKGWPERVLLDPFSGPGRIQVRGEPFTRDGGAIVAWRESAAGGFSFTRLFVGDLDANRARACEARLEKLGAPVTAFAGPAEKTIAEMVNRVPKGALCMAYVDPYNLQFLTFPILEALASVKVDLAINFSTMDLQRNAEFEFDPKRARFDGTAPGWRSDKRIKAANKKNVPLEFFRYWRGLVTGLGFEHSMEMPLVASDDGHPLYRLVFFARHDLPLRIWSDIARNPNRTRDLFED